MPKKVKPDPNDVHKWRLLETREDYCEIVRYQDKWNNEFAVTVNGVLMTPIGLPLPWGYEDYNITQQNLEPIHAKFAYGKSLVFRIRHKVAILDEMMRLSVLKTQKSFVPPKFNLSGRVVSSRTFMPGKVNHGIDPRLIFNADDKEVEGVTNAELAMVSSIQESINAETTSPTFQGQPSGDDPTATEIIEMQRQAKQMLGLTIFAMSMLEWKLEWLRLQNLIKNWFNPEDQVVDEFRDTLRNKYREISVARGIDGEGMGQRMVIPTDQPIPSPYAIMQAEDKISKEQGMPVRLIFLNPEEVTSTKICWQIVIRPRERKTSESEKLMFRAEMSDAVALQPDINYMRERFASVWGENPKKMFPNPIQTGQVDGEGNPVDPSLKTNLPSPEKAAANKIKSAVRV